MKRRIASPVIVGGQFTTGAAGAFFAVLVSVTATDQNMALAVVAGPLLLGSGALAMRALQLGVVVGDPGVRVVNFFWSRFVPWEEVERFELDRSEASAAIHGFVVCRDGSRVAISALDTKFLQSVERARRRGVAARRVAELNRLLAARRGEPLPAWPLPRRLVSWWLVLPLPAAGLAAVVGALVGVGAAGVPDEAAGLALLAGVAALPVGAARAARVRVRADEAGLRLFGWRRSRRVAWGEVDGFAVVRRRLSGWRVVARLADGGVVGLPGLRSRLAGRGGLDRKAAELGEILDDRRRLAAYEGSGATVQPGQR